MQKCCQRPKRKTQPQGVQNRRADAAPLASFAIRRPRTLRGCYCQALPRQATNVAGLLAHTSGSPRLPFRRPVAITSHLTIIFPFAG